MKINIITIKRHVLILSFLFTLISIISTLIDTKVARISFFIACYLSIFGVLICKEKYKSFIRNVPISLCLVGLSKVIWFYTFYIGNPDFDLQNSYLQSGKRVILCSILISYLLTNLKKNSYNIKIVGIALSLTFILTTLFGIHQISNDIARVELNTHATDAAYMYSCISFCLIGYFIKSELKPVITYLLIITTFAVSLYIIIKTGTRSAIIFHPIIFITLLIFSIKSHKLKLIATISSVLFITAIGFTFKGAILNKVEQTKNEILIYTESQGNRGTSLGARFAMWNGGIYSFYNYPLGTSMESRHKSIEKYTKEENKDSSALIFSMVHLHNEVIDTLSLQGILGFLVLIIFYGSMMINALKNKNTILFSIILCMIAYGLGDVLFISRQQTILFSLLIFIALLLHKEKEEEY